MTIKDTAVNLPLVSIETHNRLQPRGRTNYRRVRQYAAAMSAGQSFPPIIVGRIGKKQYVIDGHHRLEAASLAALQGLPAIIKPFRTLNDAHRAALQCNLGHGKSMSNAEKQHAFREYIAADLHLHDDSDLSHIPGSVKSLRTIAAECPVYDFRTVGRKLKELGIKAPRDEVKPYRPDADDDWDGPSDDDIATEDTIQLAQFREHLAGVATAIGHLSAVPRDAALHELRELIAALSKADQTPEAPLEI